MNREDVRLFVERWKAVEEIETEELRRTPWMCAYVRPPRRCAWEQRSTSGLAMRTIPKRSKSAAAGSN